MAGRPTKYDPSLNKQVFKLSLLGATDKEMADFLDVSVATIQNWKNEYPEFLDSIKRGKTEADAKVANSLYKKALGYKRKEVKIFQYEGMPVVVPFDAYYPPDTAAINIWLKNRRGNVSPTEGQKWADKQEHVHSVQEDQVFKINGQEIKF